MLPILAAGFGAAFSGVDPLTFVIVIVLSERVAGGVCEVRLCAVLWGPTRAGSRRRYLGGVWPPETATLKAAPSGMGAPSSL